MNKEDIKNKIRSWAKTCPKIVTPLGELAVSSFLGEGGNALVYEVNFAGPAAIKFLVESLNDHISERYLRFLDEYRNVIRIGITGAVVPLYHFGVVDIDGATIPYSIMELCSGSLENKYKSTKIKDPTEFMALLNRLLDILEIIHTAGIIHRDIKPENILLRRDGMWALADFGIAWFNPDQFERSVRTKKGDRLNNFEFSAPEQRRRELYDHPLARMDLFALGQIMYYCVTGDVIKAPGYRTFANVAPELAEYDDLVSGLVKQHPEERFQSVKEVREFLTQQNNLKAGSRQLSQLSPDYKRYYSFREQQKAFDRALRRAFPGVFGYKQILTEQEIDRVMSVLSEECTACELWYFQGYRQAEAYPINKLPDYVWLIHYNECQISEMWIYRDSVPERQYILLKMAPRPPFNIAGESSEKREEAGYYEGIYVSRGEYDDGYALINGEVVDIHGAELRCRNLTDDFSLLAPQLSVYNEMENDNVHEEVYRALLAAGKITPELLKPLEKLKRPFWMSIAD